MMVVEKKECLFKPPAKSSKARFLNHRNLRNLAVESSQSFRPLRLENLRRNVESRVNGFFF